VKALKAMDKKLKEKCSNLIKKSLSCAKLNQQSFPLKMAAIVQRTDKNMNTYMLADITHTILKM